MVVNIYGSCRRTGVGLQQPHGIVHNFCNSNHKGYNYLLWPLHIPALICKKKKMIIFKIKIIILRIVKG